MFVEESIWIRGGLEKADLRAGMTLLDVGSSTERFRRLDQPFIDMRSSGLYAGEACASSTWTPGGMRA